MFMAEGKLTSIFFIDMSDLSMCRVYLSDKDVVEIGCLRNSRYQV